MKLMILFLSLFGVSEKDIVIQVQPHVPVFEARHEIHTIEVIDPIEPHECVRVWYLSQVGVREATGKNDGKEVENYLRYTGLKKGNPWCAAFVRTGFDTCGVKTTITAWSPTARNKKNLVYFGGKTTGEIIAGKSTFTLWYQKLGREGHTGFVDGEISSHTIETVEGNTNDAGSREGDGVYKKKRQKKSVYSISNWP